MTNKTLNINLGQRSYDIIIGREILSNLSEILPFSVQGRKVFIVTDENVERYAKNVQEGLKKQGALFCEIMVLPSGEATKSYENLQKVQGWMLENAIHRNALVIAVGGGVIGDLTGFAAATVLRGVPYVQVPTTLLSQVDSSVGGKTGINTKYGKNFVGAFYQPKAVLIDLKTLETLPRRELLAGYAEIVKYGLIKDPVFFEWLEANGAKVCAMDDDALSYAIEVSCKAKAAVVQADELESGEVRALLNLGHTFGHALEAAAGYDGRLLHGEGVSIGIIMAMELSAWMNVCPREDVAYVKAHFESVGLPTSPQQIGNGFKISVDTMIETMRRDKKAKDDKITFVLMRGIGEAFVTQDVPEDLVHEVVTDALKSE